MPNTADTAEKGRKVIVSREIARMVLLWLFRTRESLWRRRESWVCWRLNVFFFLIILILD